MLNPDTGMPSYVPQEVLQLMPLLRLLETVSPQEIDSCLNRLDIWARCIRTSRRWHPIGPDVEELLERLNWWARCLRALRRPVCARRKRGRGTTQEESRANA
jgi:hypothetical protein